MVPGVHVDCCSTETFAMAEDPLKVQVGYKGGECPSRLAGLALARGV